MAKFKYLTETINLGLTKKGVTERLQELLDKRAGEGWRLVKFEISDWLGYIVVVFEKEDEYGLTK